MKRQKHDIIRCERCQSPFECKAGSITECQCSTVQLTLNETQYISEQYDGCLCAKCLMALKKEYETNDEPKVAPVNSFVLLQNQTRIMSRITILIASITLFTIPFTVSASADDPWKADQLLEPQALVNIINTNKGSALPIILNIGSSDDIKGAISTGPVSDPEGLTELKKQLKSIKKDKLIVIYCGCCPMFKCPNIRPAFKELVAEGYTNIRVLSIKTNLKIDWVDKKYPMAGSK